MSFLQSCCAVKLCDTCKLWNELSEMRRNPSIPALLKLLRSHCPHLVIHALTENFNWHLWQLSSSSRQQLAEYVAALAACGSNICVDYVLRGLPKHPLLDEISGQSAWWILANARNGVGGPVMSQAEVRELLMLGILDTPLPNECEFRWLSFAPDDPGMEVKHKPLHERIVLMAENARRCWRPCRHKLFHHGFRRLITLLHLIAFRLAKEDKHSESKKVMRLPPELWHNIFGMLERDGDYKAFGFCGYIGPYLLGRA